MSGMISITGLSFTLGKKCLARAEANLDHNSPLDVISYKAIDAVQNHCAGTWSRLDEYDEATINGALRAGEFWSASTYIRFFGQIKTEQGKFAEAATLTGKWSEITEAYNHDMGRLQCYALKADFLIKTKQLHEATVEAESGISLSFQRNLAPNQIHLIGHKLIALIMLDDVERAKKTIVLCNELIAEQDLIAPVFCAPYLLGLFLTDIHVLRHDKSTSNSVSSPQDRQRAYKSGKAVLKNSYKYVPYRTWIFRLMGDYYWLINKQSKALKWWDKSIKEGERLGAQPDLSRTYFEVGKHMLKPESKYKHFNGIDANGYLEKAGILFEEMGLERDLEDLERVRMEL